MSERTKIYSGLYMRDGERTNIGNLQRYNTDIANAQGHRWDYIWYITRVHKIMGNVQI